MKTVAVISAIFLVISISLTIEDLSLNLEVVTKTWWQIWFLSTLALTIIPYGISLARGVVNDDDSDGEGDPGDDPLSAGGYIIGGLAYNIFVCGIPVFLTYLCISDGFVQGFSLWWFVGWICAGVVWTLCLAGAVTISSKARRSTTIDTDSTIKVT